MNARSAFLQKDLDRIFKAAKRAGVGARLKPDGTVDILPVSVEVGQTRNPWDSVFDETPPSPSR